ncbi:MAG TPA: FkbM family methyltransferase, partial [Micropepsaceae bacterium]
LIFLAASLNTITTYVLLEQEAWFEKEAKFLPLLIKPGMVALDIGANAGVYSLALARSVGPSGKVYAYEPGAAPRRLLEKSRNANGFDNLQIVPAAVSDRSGRGHLEPSVSSELASLGGSALGESVSVTSLDEEDASRNWGSPDFVKIDAEGEERRILEGGRGFFARHSPLVMFEFKAADVVDKEIAEAFRASGYRIFRLLPGAPFLVPVNASENFDSYELNLFAAKPDRIAALARAGWLSDEMREWSPGDSARTQAMDLWAAQAFGPALARLPPPPMGSPYRDALAGYAVWRSQTADLALRHAALRFSYGVLRELCRASGQAAHLSTFARVAWDLGERRNVIAILEAIVAQGREHTGLAQPFWPVNPRFDAIAPQANVGQWFLISVLEQLERASAHSSMFLGEGLNLDWLGRQPFASTEITRRNVLKQLRAGKRLAVPEKLCRPASDHRNSELWRSGLIPNTLAS